MKYQGRVIASSLSLKFVEQLLVKGTTVIVGIVLARLLDVADFGIIAILTIFTSLATAIIEGGLSTSLIQIKEVDDLDYSTVFYTTCGLSVLLYGILYFCAPLIADYYEIAALTTYLRAIGLMLFATPFNTTQLGYVYKNMLFKQLLISSVATCLISGTVGIALAYCGAGVWALVAQTLCNSLVSVLLLFVIIPWKPKLCFSFARLKMHFSYGWKLLVASIVDTLYIDLRALIIGKRYTSDDLAYYNRGDTYPKTVITSLNTAIQSVMLPVLSSEQDNRDALKQTMRRTVALSSFVLFPIMAGFAAVGDSFVLLVLTEKWMPCVVYLQLACLTYAIQPISSCNLQAIKAIGRSDIFLRLTLIKKLLGCCIVVFTAFYFKTPMAIAIGVALYAPVELIINALPNKKLVGYTVGEQARDIILPLLFSLIMFLTVYAFGMLSMRLWIKLPLQIVLGIAVYVVLSLAFRVPAMHDALKILAKFKSKKEKRETEE